MLDRDYFYIFVHSLLYFECLSFPGFPCYVNSPLHFLEQESGKRCVKNIKINWFWIFDQMLIMFFLWEKCSNSFRLIGYCFLLLLGVMIRKCLQTLSCTNPNQASSGPQISTRRQKKILCSGSLPAWHDWIFFIWCDANGHVASNFSRKKKCNVQHSAILCTTALHWRVRLFQRRLSKAKYFWTSF